MPDHTSNPPVPTLAVPEAVLVGVRSVDVLINGSRTWSTSDWEAGVLGWPEVVLPHLAGTADVSVVDSGSGVVLHSTRIVFDDDPAPTVIVDGSGRHLALNKWGKLSPTLAGSDPEALERLLARTKALIDDLASDGFEVFITGGTLLGAVRSGDLLPHDDDADLGFYIQGEEIADLVLESFRMQRALERRGYRIVRHSGAHLQVTFLLESGALDHYVDIFSAFYRDGEFCQPIAVRGSFTPAQLLPLTTLPIRGGQFPSVPDAEGWLALCYGPAWRTPDPSFRFETPLSTRSRFEGWFGSFNLNRDFWERVYWPGADPSRGRGEGPERILRALPAGTRVLDLACGDGALAAALIENGHDVLAADFAFHALTRAAAALAGRAELRYLNLNDRRETLALAVEELRAGRAPHVVLDHVMQTLDESGRASAYVLLRQLLRVAGTTAVLTIDTDLPAWHEFGNPTSWHLPLETLSSEAAREGLECEVIETYERETPDGRRAAALVRVTFRNGAV